MDFSLAFLAFDWRFIFPDLSLDKENVLTQWFIEIFFGETCFDLRPRSRAGLDFWNFYQIISGTKYE